MDDQISLDAPDVAVMPAESDDPEALRAQIAALASRADALETRWRESLVTGTLALALQQAGCRDVDAAQRLIERTAITVGDTGDVQGIPEAVAALKQARGYLFSTWGARAGINPGDASASPSPAAALATWLRGG